FGFCLMLVPLLHHLLSGPDDRAQQTSILHAASGFGLAPLFITHYFSYFSPSFLFEEADANIVIRHYLPGHGALYWFEAPFLLAGLCVLLRRHQRSDFVVLA